MQQRIARMIEAGEFLAADVPAQAAPEPEAPAVDFLTAELDDINPDLRDVLENGLLTVEHRADIRQSIDAGATNSQLAGYFSNTFPREAETMTLTSGETADYFTTPHGLSIEVQDRYNSKLGFSWADIAPVVRTLTPEWEREPAQAAVAEPEAPAAPVEITQDDIDAAIIGWNGDPESKRRVYNYMCLHARERDTAAYLKEQYGGQPGLVVSKEGAEPVTVPWPKVQRHIAQLMDWGEFLPPVAAQELEQAHSPEQEHQDAAPVPEAEQARFIVKTVTRVQQISSNPRIVDLPENTTAYAC